MGLLQPEDLSNHVFCGGMQQDTPGSQSHHYISAHWRQAHGNGVWAYKQNSSYFSQRLTFLLTPYPHSSFNPFRYSHNVQHTKIILIRDRGEQRDLHKYKFCKRFPCCRYLPLR